MSAEPIATVSIVPSGKGFGVQIDNLDLPDETLADLLHAAADKLEGKDGDRAAGCWGR